MRRIIFLIIINFLTLLSVYPQSINDLKQSFDDAEYFFARGDYEEAAYYYKLIVAKFPDNANFNFKLGECYLNIPGSEALAIPYFKVAVRNTVEKSKYRKRDFSETKAPLHAYFYLGNAYRYNNQLDEAMKAYTTFINSPFYYGNYNETIVENEIKSCERAKIIQDSPIAYTEEALDSIINTSSSELNPVVSEDETVLVFVRRLKFYDAIMYSVKQNGAWMQPVNLNPIIGSDGDFYPTCLSSDKKTLYLVKRDTENSDIYVSYQHDSTWTKAEKLNKNINSLSNETAAWISEDGKTLYFSSDRHGGYGGKDIYYSVKNSENQWGKAHNAGKIINTQFDEDSPCLAGSDQVLFFSSKGHYGMGGYDIFYSVRSGKKWGEPVNIGYPVNTTGDNTGYVALRDGKTGYISKINTKNSTNEDIFRIVIKSFFQKPR